MIRMIIAKNSVKTIKNKTQSDFGNPVMQQTACQGLRTGKLGKYVLT